jgi:hypothetical protein
MLYAIPAGLAAGWLMGGGLAGIGRLQIRLAWLAVLGYLGQSLLFAPSLARLLGPAGPLLYTGSNALVLAVLVANARIRGMPVVALGALANLVAIALNGGSMPADAAAYAANGMTTQAHLNTRFLAHPLVPFLGDWIALPRWLPGTNVISVGDLLIGIGIALVVAAAMRDDRPVQHEHRGQRAGAAGDGSPAGPGTSGPASQPPPPGRGGPVRPGTRPGTPQYEEPIDALRHLP